MICCATQSFEIVRGQALQLLIPVTNDDGADTDLTGATAEFGFALNDASPYIETITPTIDGSTLVVTLTGAITAGLTQSRYWFSAWVTIAGAPTPVARGVMIVCNDPRGLAE